MSLDPTTAWLLGEGPDPGAEALSELLDVAPPPELSAATLALVEAARAEETRAEEARAEETRAEETLPELRPANDKRAWRLWAGAAAAAAAVIALTLIGGGDRVGDPDKMVARGDAETQPSVVLKMAVQEGPELERLREVSYAPGSTLFFRVQADNDGWSTLLRVDAERVELLDQREVGAGERDLLLDGQPLAWTLEAGDPDSVFVVLGTDHAIQDQVLKEVFKTRALSGHAEDADAVCALAMRAGLRCDASWVGVKP